MKSGKFQRAITPPRLSPVLFLLVLGVLVSTSHRQWAQPADPLKDFFVTLPPEGTSLFEAPAGDQEPGFPLRGIKGWAWTADQYLEEIPHLASLEMNFLMNCYLSMYDIENYHWTDPESNRWWEPLPEEKRDAYEQIVRECQKNGIEFCFSMNPNLFSSRILDYSNPGDVEALWAHYAWMQGLGVRWFNISLDDISAGIDAAGQVKVVNDLHARLLENDSEVNMTFTPTHYSGTGENDPYIEVLARDLHPDIYCFWTGDSIVGPITRAGAEAYKNAIQHPLIFWDNYPVNDAQPTLNLGPSIHRDPRLNEAVHGYMSNPMHSQNEINRLPLATSAHYAYNPTAYDPHRSIGRAIFHFAETPAQRSALRDLVELYPGFVILQQPSPGFNPVRDRFSTIMEGDHSVTLAAAYIARVEELLGRLESEFPGRYAATRKTVRDDLELMKREFEGRFGRAIP